MRGIITKYDSGRKFGFIRSKEDENNDVFFHLSDVIDGADKLSAGASVSFKMGKGEKGPKAIEVSVVRIAVSPYKFFIGAAFFLTVAITFIVATSLPTLAPIFAYLIGINAAMFILTGLDKSSSQGTATRVPEKVLFGLAALGGSLGMVAGMQIFRHKTKKPGFKFMVALIFAAQVFLFRVVFPDFTLRP